MSPSRLGLLTLVVWLFAPSANGQTVDGFKGYKWGTPFNVMKSKFQLVKNAVASLTPHKDMNGEWALKDSLYPDAVWYITNIQFLGTPSLSVDVDFKFYQDRFCAVKIWTHGDMNSKRLAEMWTKAYGKGGQSPPDDHIGYYHWEIGKDSRADLTRYIAGVPADAGITPLGELIYYSVSIDTLQYKNDMEKRKW